MSVKKEDIYFEGMRLRGELLNEFRNKYIDRALRILIHTVSNGAWKYGFESWGECLDFMGCETTVLENLDDIPVSAAYDVFINITDRIYLDKALTIIGQTIPHKIGLASKTYNFRDGLMLSAISGECSELDMENAQRVIDYRYDFLISPMSEPAIHNVFSRWVEEAGINIHSIPFGFNPIVHYPECVDEDYDFFFVGTNSYYKQEETRRYLLPIIRKYTGVLMGVNWPPSHIALALYPDQTRSFYSKAMINLNYHDKFQRVCENEINERTYVISACGGFQLVDSPAILHRFYSNDDMAIAADEDEYRFMFEYYLYKEKARHEMAYNAMVKSYRNKYSLFHRLEDLINAIPND